MSQFNHPVLQTGLFISFEGVETSGKTTQADLLSEWFEGRDVSVVRVREPGSTPVGEEIREILLSSEDEIQPAAEMFLFAAARAQLVRQVIKPALSKGEVVICDRFIDSSLAYQGYGLGLEPELVWDVNRPAVDNTIPDLTFVLGSGPNLQQTHYRDSEDRIEARNQQFHDRVRRGYLRLSECFPQRIVIIDTSSEIKDTAQNIQRVIVERFPQLK